MQSVSRAMETLKNKQVTFNKQSEKQMLLIQQMKMVNNDIKEGLLNHSIALQSIKKQLETGATLMNDTYDPSTPMTTTPMPTIPMRPMPNVTKSDADKSSQFKFSESNPDIPCTSDAMNSFLTMHNSAKIIPSPTIDTTSLSTDTKEPQTPTISSEIKQADIHNDQGNKLYKNKKFKEAILEHKKAQQLCPTNPTYFMNESAALLMMGKLNQCKKCCINVIKMTSESEWLIKAYKRIGLIMEKQNNMIPAMEYYVKILALNSNDDVRTKVGKWVDRNKDAHTEAEKNIMKNEKWKCLNCTYTNNSSDVSCVKCGFHSDISLLTIKFPCVFVNYF